MRTLVVAEACLRLGGQPDLFRRVITATTELEFSLRIAWCFS